MTDLLDKAGSGSVEPEDFNAVVDAIESGPNGKVTAADIDSLAAQDGDVLTADGAGNATWEAGGGSQPVAVVRVPITFDTPNIGTTGAALYTPALGDIISIAYVNNITPWNGTNPSGYCFAQGSGDPRGESIIGFDPTGTNTTSTPTFDIATNPFFGVAALIATAATPVVVAVLNSSDGSDPGATAGELELVLLVLKAS